MMNELKYQSETGSYLLSDLPVDIRINSYFHIK